MQVDHDGEIKFNHPKPDMTVGQIIDVNYLEELGLNLKIRFIEGISESISEVFDNFLLI